MAASIRNKLACKNTSVSNDSFMEGYHTLFGTSKTILCFIGESNQREHHRYFNQNADNSRQRCARIQAKQADRHRNGELKEIRCTDQGRGRCHIRGAQWFGTLAAQASQAPRQQCITPPKGRDTVRICRGVRRFGGVIFEVVMPALCAHPQSFDLLESLIFFTMKIR